MAVSFTFSRVAVIYGEFRFIYQYTLREETFVEETFAVQKSPQNVWM